MASRNQPPDSLPAGARDHPEVIAACRERDIGRLFRLVNNLTDGPHQFTAAHLARRCGISPSRVGEYMDGKHHARSLDVVIRVADGLRIPGARFGLGPRPWEQPRDHPAPLVLASKPPLPARVAVHGGPPPDVTDGFAIETLPGFATSRGAQQPLTDADVPVIRAMLSALTATDHQFGGGHARRAATAFLTDVIEPRLAARGPQSVRLELLRAASEFGIRVAWMHLDVADDTAARRSANLAFQWAQESGDLSCAGWVMSMCALLETWIGEPRRALAYARAAVGLTQDSPPLVRAFAYGKLARAHALAGERAETAGTARIAPRCGRSRLPSTPVRLTVGSCPAFARYFCSGPVRGSTLRMSLRTPATKHPSRRGSSPKVRGSPCVWTGSALGDAPRAGTAGSVG